MRTPARAILGPRRAGLELGYRVLGLDRAEVTPWTRAGVTETRPGDYVAAVESPRSGGWVVWGTWANPDMAEAELAPLPPDPPAPPVVDLTPISEAIRHLGAQLSSLPAPVVDLSGMVAELATMRHEVTGLLEGDQQRAITDRADVQLLFNRVGERIAQLERLNESAHQFAHLDAAAERFAAMTALGERLTNAGLGIVDLMSLTREFAQLRVDLNTLHEAMQTTITESKREATERSEALSILDELLAQVAT